MELMLLCFMDWGQMLNSFSVHFTVLEKLFVVLVRRPLPYTVLTEAVQNLTVESRNSDHNAEIQKSVLN